MRDHRGKAKKKKCGCRVWTYTINGVQFIETDLCKKHEEEINIRKMIVHHD